mmetsp:Transcript_3710/g.8501  ORF Transcript_3710/g.8501 Transcript_3710/m.8501 type:complete len:385 (-) Transcript_3710:23-1177(-)
MRKTRAWETCFCWAPPVRARCGAAPTPQGPALAGTHPGLRGHATWPNDRRPRPQFPDAAGLSPRYHRRGHPEGVRRGPRVLRGLCPHGRLGLRLRARAVDQPIQRLQGALQLAALLLGERLLHQAPGHLCPPLALGGGRLLLCCDRNLEGHLRLAHRDPRFELRLPLLVVEGPQAQRLRDGVGLLLHPGGEPRVLLGLRRGQDAGVGVQRQLLERAARLRRRLQRCGQSGHQGRLNAVGLGVRLHGLGRRVPAVILAGASAQAAEVLHDGGELGLLRAQLVPGLHHDRLPRLRLGVLLVERGHQRVVRFAGGALVFHNLPGGLRRCRGVFAERAAGVLGSAGGLDSRAAAQHALLGRRHRAREGLARDTRELGLEIVPGLGALR